MARTVIPPPKAAREAEEAKSDQLPEKLIKYIPGETLAFLVPVTAALGTNHDGWLIVALVVAALGTPAYLWNSAQKLPANQRPLLHFYALAVIALGCWALGSCRSVSELIGLDDVVAGVILALAVFAIPLADSLLNRVQGRNSN